MRKDVLTSLREQQLGNWIVKASVLDDQILIVMVNFISLTTYCEMFYNEDLAYSFIERVLSDD